MWAAQCSKSPAVVEALLNANANLKAKNKVGVFGTIIGEPHMYSLITRVFVEAWLDPCDDRCAKLWISGCCGCLGELEDKFGEGEYELES